MKNILKVMGNVAAWIVSIAVVLTVLICGHLYANGFGFNTKDGVYMDYKYEYGHITDRYGHLTFDDVVTLNRISNDKLDLIMYGYFPTSTEIDPN